MESNSLRAGRWGRPRGSRSVTGLALATLAPALAVGVAAGVVTAAPAQAALQAGESCTVVGELSTCTATFLYTGAPQDWTVPAGVDKATFTLTGASGGAAGGRLGGRGGGVTATLDVTAGTLYRLYVGGRGGSDTDSPGERGLGGWNGGGNGAGPLNPAGAGGGGASDLRVAPYGTSNRLVVAGGGGGPGSHVWGDVPRGVPGAGGNGGSGLSIAPPTAGGDVSGISPVARGGGAGTSTAAGAGGAVGGGFVPGCAVWDNTSSRANAGEAGHGARGGAGGFLSRVSDGQRCDLYKGWGGGGGGGWYGGGGGGGGVTGGPGVAAAVATRRPAAPRQPWDGSVSTAGSRSPTAPCGRASAG